MGFTMKSASCPTLWGIEQTTSGKRARSLCCGSYPRRNQIYRDLILGSVEIVNDIRQVCLSNTKMTEKQRIEIVLAIRPKLQVMNKKLQRLGRAVKYTSFGGCMEGDRRRNTTESGQIGRSKSLYAEVES